MSLQDKQLVEKTLSGDKDAFGVLVERYQSAAYGLAFHMLGNFVDAQDAAQEAFIRAYSNLHTLKDPSKFAGWLRGIVRNVCLSWRRKREKTISIEEAKEPALGNPQPPPDEELERRVLWERVMRAVNSLPEKSRLVVTLYYIDGLSYKDIASFLDIPVNTVKDRLRRARGKLKEKMLQIVEEEFERYKLTQDFKEKISKAIEGLRNITLLSVKVEGSKGEIPAELKEILEDVVKKYGGITGEGEEGGLSVLFGAEASHEDDPERAILTALEMREKLAELDEELNFRASITTGMAEIRGERCKLSCDFLRLTYNLIKAASGGKILVDECSYMLSKGRFIFRKFEGRDIQGYEVLGRAEHPRKLWGIDELRSRMIGREGEFANLKKYVDKLLKGEGRIVSIIGEAGIGKSRMASELRGYAEEREVLWLEGRCISYGQRISYIPFLEVMREFFDIRMSDSDDEMKRKIETEVRQRIRDAEDLTPYIFSFISRVDPEETRGLTAEQLRYKRFIAIRELFRRTSRERPIVVAIEDLQWIDEASYELLTYLIGMMRGYPVMFLCIYRPERDSPCWQLRKEVSTRYPERYSEVPLFSLSSEDSRLLLRELLSWEFPPSVEDHILGKAEGNPFFLEEMIRALINSGKLVRRGKGWELRDELGEMEIPSTIFSVISSRVDMLEDDSKYALRYASVIGDILPVELLREISEDEPVKRLEELDFLVRDETGGGYVFKHALIKDVVYAGLFPELRAELHREIAEAIERIYGDRLDEHYEVLAYHWGHTDRIERRVEYLLKAGKKAKRVYSNRDAIDYLREALKLLKENPLGESRKDWRLEALKELGQLYHGIGKGLEAEKYLREAIALGREIKLDVHELVRLYYWLGEVLYWQRRWDEKIRLGKEGLALLGDETESVEAALMNDIIAEGYLFKGDREKRREFTLRNTRFVRRLPYTEELKAVYEHISNVYADAKNLDEAFNWLDALEREAGQYRDLRALAIAHHIRGSGLARKGDFHGAIREQRQALELLEKIGDPKTAIWCYHHLMRAFLILDELQEAEKWANKAYEILEEVKSEAIAKAYESRLDHLCIGMIHFCKDDKEKAEEVLLTSARLFREMDIPDREVMATYALGRAYLAWDRSEEAEKLLQETIESAKEKLYRLAPLLLHLIQHPLVGALSGLEEVYHDDPEKFLKLCCRLREKGCEFQDSTFLSPFTQWYLEPSEPVDFPQPLLHDEFAETLSRDWRWEDPFGDSSFNTGNGLEIHAANGRDLWHLNLSAPRVLRPICGDFAAQTVCIPAFEDKLAIGGMLLWKDRENYLHLTRGIAGENEISFMGCIGNKDVIIGRGRLSSERVFLRLERLTGHVRALCSPDGEEWFTVGNVDFQVEDPIEVGLHGISVIDRTIYQGTYPEGTATRFESFRLWGEASE